MRRELKIARNGDNGAATITMTDIFRIPNGKQKRRQAGKLTVRKCFIVWHDRIETGNNKYQVNWDEFISFMKEHPARKASKPILVS